MIIYDFHENKITINLIFIFLIIHDHEQLKKNLSINLMRGFQNHIINTIYFDFFVFKISTKVGIWQSRCCGSGDRNDERRRSRQGKRAAQRGCDATHERSQGRRGSKEPQQDDSGLRGLVSSRAHGGWESRQGFCGVEGIEARRPHARLGRVTQADNDDENTGYSSQLCWDVKDGVKPHH